MKRKVVCLLLACMCLLCSFGSAQQAETEKEDVQIDLDLTMFSGNVVYAQVYQMMVDPKAYVGKVIRVSGLLDVFEDTQTGMVYTSCIIPDATACCAQGIEFVWAGDHLYPDAYPETGSELTVTGRFETYMEGEYMYIHLCDADVAWADSVWQ